MWRMEGVRRLLLLLLLPLLVCLQLDACAAPVPTEGSSTQEVLKAWGPPTATYPLDGGARRLEFASGPYGRTTWMVDVDAMGRVIQSRQVLNEAAFFQVQLQPGLSRDALLRWLGTPGERRGARGGGETWSWRYPTNDCLWFQVSLGADALMQGASFGIDPSCDAPSDKSQ
jgi:hypothetical protein